MRLEKDKNYGFTVIGVSDSRQLPVWDVFRLEKIHDICATGNTIVDFGNSSRALSELFAQDLRNKEKISVDINPACNPDIVADMCDLGEAFGDGTMDGIICASMLEHVYDPFKAVRELYRILKPGGKMFVYVPWMWHYHSPASGECLDYYRFSRDGVRHLFKHFSHVELCPVRGWRETILNFVPWLGKGSLFLKVCGRLLRRFDRYDERHTSGFTIFIIK